MLREIQKFKITSNNQESQRQGHLFLIGKKTALHQLKPKILLIVLCVNHLHFKQ